jgi:uncharacterized membrane protein YraQ (UPF0718 family)
MNAKPQARQLRGLRFLALVGIGYVLLFSTHSQQAQQSLLRIVAIMGQILPIIGVVVVFNGVLNWWLPAPKMAKIFREQGSKRSWGIAIIAGVISHGPMYLWYPMIADMRNGGVPDGMLVTYFYARAVKLPLLPLMIDYFGLLFSVVLIVYILIFALLQGLAMQAWISRRSTG